MNYHKLAYHRLYACVCLNSTDSDGLYQQLADIRELLSNLEFISLCRMDYRWSVRKFVDLIITYEISRNLNEASNII